MSAPPRSPEPEPAIWLTKWDVLRLIRSTYQAAGRATEFLHRLAYLRQLLPAQSYPDRVLVQDALFGLDEDLADLVRADVYLLGTGYHQSEEDGFGVSRPRMGMVNSRIQWEQFERLVVEKEEELNEAKELRRRRAAGFVAVSPDVESSVSVEVPIVIAATVASRSASVEASQSTIPSSASTSSDESSSQEVPHPTTATKTQSINGTATYYTLETSSSGSDSDDDIPLRQALAGPGPSTLAARQASSPPKAPAAASSQEKRKRFVGIGIPAQSVPPRFKVVSSASQPRSPSTPSDRASAVSGDARPQAGGKGKEAMLDEDEEASNGSRVSQVISSAKGASASLVVERPPPPPSTSTSPTSNSARPSSTSKTQPMHKEKQSFKADSSDSDDLAVIEPTQKRALNKLKQAAPRMASQAVAPPKESPRERKRAGRIDESKQAKRRKSSLPGSASSRPANGAGAARKGVAGAVRARVSMSLPAADDSEEEDELLLA